MYNEGQAGQNGWPLLCECQPIPNLTEPLYIIYEEVDMDMCNWCKPCEQQIWRRSPDQSWFDWTSDRLTSVRKLAASSRTLPGTAERRRRIFSHFSSRSVSGSPFPASSVLSLHPWIQGSLHCLAYTQGLTWFLWTKIYTGCHLATWNALDVSLNRDFVVGRVIYKQNNKNNKQQQQQQQQ